MTSEKPIAVVILAAGESRRMGRPKALLPFPKDFLPGIAARARLMPAPMKTSAAGAASSDPTKLVSEQSKTFLCHLMEATRHPRTGILRVVVGAHAGEIRESARLDADELVINDDWQRGQLSSLKAAIRSLPAGATEGILVCLVDHPLISTNVVAQLVAAFDESKRAIVIPTFEGKRGHPVIFPAELYGELLNAPEEVGARAVVHAHATEIREVSVEEEGVILNLNDPESLKTIPNRDNEAD